MTLRDTQEAEEVNVCLLGSMQPRTTARKLEPLTFEVGGAIIN